MCVCVLRGSAISRIIGQNVKASNRFDPIVNLWVFEEFINGRKLTDIINTEHENAKYLPGHKLPKNVVRTHFSHTNHLNISLSLNLTVCLSVSVTLFVCLSILLSVCLSYVCRSISFYVCLTFCLPVILSV